MSGEFRGAAHSICNLRYKVQREIPVKIHNGSKYDYHFIIKELAEEFKGQFECLGENTEKFITFSVPIKKENEDGKTNTYKIKFIDICRFMQINNKDYKKCMERKKIRSECELIGLKDNRLEYKCKECNDISTKSVDDLIAKFPRTYKFCNGNLNKFVLLLRKGGYPYEYMNSWGSFNETSLPSKKSCYSESSLENISDKDYLHAQKVWDVFEITNLGEYHDLYFQTDTLLLADVYEKFRDKRIDIYGLDPSYFLSAPGLTWQACLEKANTNLKLLTDVDKLLMIELGIRGGMCQSIHRYAKGDNKYMNNYDKSIKSSYLMFLDANNLYGWEMSKK